jgi:hypothetical protein
MKTDYEERLIRIRVVSSLVPALFIAAILLFGLIKPVFGPCEEPVDSGTDKMRRLVTEARVTDSNNNGFRVVYATSSDVTAARAEEIRSRRHIYDSIARLKVEAPRRFGDMLHTDIYDFTEFSLRFDPDPDILIHNVFVHGREKINLYVGPNPAILNPAEWISNKTLQGALYINREDILRYTSHSQRVYRYWSCRTPWQSSDNDEHFSHFSEDERLY